jgi:lipoate---protein ligase
MVNCARPAVRDGPPEDLENCSDPAAFPLRCRCRWCSLGCVPPGLLYLDRTCPTPEANLALDEALLEWCAQSPEREVLRCWESAIPFVVLGRTNAAATEVDLDACAQLGLPVLRRCSGGGTVIQGPGCLSYAVVLRLDRQPELAGITGTNRWILDRHRAVLADLLGEPVQVEGITDLTRGGRKFSGNAQKRGRTHLLFHGTFLLRFDLALMQRVLRPPSRAPAYRADRTHAGFVDNLAVPAEAVRCCLRECWQASAELADDLEPVLSRLLEERYLLPEWHRRY